MLFGILQNATSFLMGLRYLNIEKYSLLMTKFLKTLPFLRLVSISSFTKYLSEEGSFNRAAISSTCTGSRQTQRNREREDGLKYVIRKF